MISYKVQIGSKELALQMETLRFSSYGITATEEDYDPHYLNSISNGNILVVTSYNDGKLVAGCYISNTFHSLYIDYLFVLKDYQEQGLHIGRQLLEFILANKSIVEEYFGESFTESRLCSVSKKSTSIYKKVGYNETDKEDLLCKKLGN